MTIQYCSDLHLEFRANREWLEANPISPEGDIMLIAGDTFYLGQNFNDLPFLDYLSQSFYETYLLPGNHEYYGGFDVEKHQSHLMEPLRHNVWLVNNCIIEKQDVKFVFSTLWSRIEKNIIPILQGMVDFRRIRYNKRLLNIDDYNQMHKTALNFLQKDLLAKSKKKQVVISHHLPSELCNAKEFKRSLLNEAFCIDLTSFIENTEVDVWIYGHSHRNIEEFKIGNTLMLTNQLGYVDAREHHNFKGNAFFDL